MSDATIAAIARPLAHALARWGYSRQPEDHEAVRLLHTELCQAVAEEEVEAQQKQEQQQEPPHEP